MRLTSCKYAALPISLALGGLIAVLATGSPALGDSVPGDLDKLRETLTTVEQDIKRNAKRRDETSIQIEKVETDINTTITRQRKTTAKLADVKHQIAILDEKSAVARADLALNADAIRALIRNVHARGQTSELKLLLGNADPVRMGRALVWYRYVANARTDAISGVRDVINTLSETQATKATQKVVLADLAKRLDDDATYLERSKRNKKTLLASIDTDTESKKSRAESLREAEALMVREIDAIAAREKLRKDQAREKAARDARQALGNSPRTEPKTAKAPFVPKLSGKDFIARRGLLPFPVNGEIAARFGERKSATYAQTSNGIMIHATEGDPVRAVADGVVAATSNWPFVGPSIYLAHGDGYITVYTHNSDVVKARGDRVTAGEIIAYVGSSGLDRPGLYFILRHAEIGYLDPLKWLKTP